MIQKMILEYIKKHRNDVHLPSIQKMSKELYIAPNSVMRLSKKLGYSGFAELKFALQKENQPQNKTIDRITAEQYCKNIEYY